MCGVSTTLGSAAERRGTSGSSANTSSAAARRRPARERVGERALVDEAAARRVDEHRLGPHAGEQLGRADQVAACRRGQRQVQRDDVGAPSSSGSGTGDAGGGGSAGSQTSSVDVEAAQPAGHRAADLAVADEPDRRPVQVPRRQLAAARATRRAGPRRRARRSAARRRGSSPARGRPPSRGWRRAWWSRRRRPRWRPRGRSSRCPTPTRAIDAQARGGREHGAVERVGAHDRGDRGRRRGPPPRRACARRAWARGCTVSPRRRSRPPVLGPVRVEAHPRHQDASRLGRPPCRPLASGPAARLREAPPAYSRRYPSTVAEVVRMAARRLLRHRRRAMADEDPRCSGRLALDPVLGPGERAAGGAERAVDRARSCCPARGCRWPRSPRGGTRCRPRGRGPRRPGCPGALGAGRHPRERVRERREVVRRGALGGEPGRLDLEDPPALEVLGEDRRARGRSRAARRGRRGRTRPSAARG